MAPAAQKKDQQVDNRLIEEPDGEPICAMLQAVRHLEAVVRKQEALGDASRSTVRSTRVLIKLMEGWCVDHAIRTRHLAIASLRRSLLVIQLGGPVGDRASFGEHGNAIAAKMAQRLDLGLATPWQATRDPIIALGSLLTQITGVLGKLGVDVTLLAQNEIAAVRIEGGGGSSAMAHKSNPVNAEVLVALARYNAGLSGTLAQAQLHENERSGAAWTLEWLTLPPMLVNTGASLRLAQKLLDQLRIA